MSRELQLAWNTIWRSFAQLNEQVFSCLLSPEYPDCIYLFEHRIHEAKKNVLAALIAWRKVVTKEKSDEVGSPLNKISTFLDQVHSILLDYALLRHRVKDYALLQVCSSEMQAVFRSSQRMFVWAAEYLNDAAHIDHILNGGLIEELKETKDGEVTQDVADLHEAIQRLEENVQQVIQVTAPDPFVFILFISSLNQFCKQIKKIPVM